MKGFDAKIQAVTASRHGGGTGPDYTTYSTMLGYKRSIPSYATYWQGYLITAVVAGNIQYYWFTSETLFNTAKATEFSTIADQLPIGNGAHCTPTNPREVPITNVTTFFFKIDGKPTSIFQK